MIEYISFIVISLFIFHSCVSIEYQQPEVSTVPTFREPLIRRLTATAFSKGISVIVVSLFTKMWRFRFGRFSVVLFFPLLFLSCASLLFSCLSLSAFCASLIFTNLLSVGFVCSLLSFEKLYLIIYIFFFRFTYNDTRTKRNFLFIAKWLEVRREIGFRSMINLINDCTDKKICKITLKGRTEYLPLIYLPFA